MSDSFPDLERMELVTGSQPGGFATWQGVLTAALAQSVDDRLLKHLSPESRKGGSGNTMADKQPQKKTAKKKKAVPKKRNSVKLHFWMGECEWWMFVGEVPKMVLETCDHCKSKYPCPKADPEMDSLCENTMNTLFRDKKDYKPGTIITCTLTRDES
jgi:hypothetical protein